MCFWGLDSERSFCYGVIMVRQREYDPSEALDRAMTLFWQQGYFDTSMDDLVKATGVSRYGLYETYGNKQGLFAAALDRYQDFISSKVQHDIRLPDAALPEIKGYFNRLKTLTRTEQGRFGCLLVNTATEVAIHDEQVAVHVRKLMNSLTMALKRALDNAKVKKQLRADMDTQAYADYLTGVMQGILVMARSGCKSSNIKNTVEIALAGLD